MIHNMFENADQEFETLERMDQYGGSFVKQLALLYRLADRFNKFKLTTVFFDYFMEYREWEKNHK